MTGQVVHTPGEDVYRTSLTHLKKIPRPFQEAWAMVNADVLDYIAEAFKRGQTPARWKEVARPDSHFNKN